VPCQKVGNTLKLVETPSLPGWALREGSSTEASPDDHVEEVPATEASAPAFWRLANEALELGIPHERIRHIAQSANGDGWEGEMALLKGEMVKAA